jgi:hypothetical protein
MSPCGVDRNMKACQASDRRSFSTSRDGVTSAVAPLLKLQVCLLMYLVDVTSGCAARARLKRCGVSRCHRCTQSETFVTARRRALRERVAVPRVGNRFSVLYATRTFITVLATACHLSVSGAKLFHSIFSHTISLRSILILPFHVDSTYCMPRPPYPPSDHPNSVR